MYTNTITKMKRLPGTDCMIYFLYVHKYYKKVERKFEFYKVLF